jgi:hypothetical protein
VECLLLSAIQNCLQARWIGQPENTEAVHRVHRVRKRKNCVIEATHFGVDVGAQTTANDSGNILWKPECVWRSTEDIKHDWVGWVWI